MANLEDDSALRLPTNTQGVIRYPSDNPWRFGRFVTDQQPSKPTETTFDETTILEALDENTSFRNSRAKLLPVIDVVERECRGESGDIIEPLGYRLRLLVMCLGSLEYSMRLPGLSLSRSNIREASVFSIARVLGMDESNVREVFEQTEEYAYPSKVILDKLATEVGIVSLKARR